MKEIEDRERRSREGRYDRGGREDKQREVIDREQDVGD